MERNEEHNGFYKDRYFEQLDKRLEAMEKKIDAIDAKMWYIYGFAGAVTFVGSFTIDWVKSRFQ